MKKLSKNLLTKAGNKKEKIEAKKKFIDEISNYEYILIVEKNMKA